jgi:AraC-like DNA-binding protein
VTGPARDVDAVLDVTHASAQPLVSLSYSAPVEIDAGDFSRLFLMMHCARGGASATQEQMSIAWHAGQTMPFSAGFETRLRFDPAFLQRSVRLDPDKLESLCARWLGHPLEEPLRFALRPFSADFERIWQSTLSYLWSIETSGLRLTGRARAAFDEYLLALVLQYHPHNYSDEIQDAGPTPVPGVVRRAERLMSDDVDGPTTVSDIASRLGVSMRSLQSAFRAWRGTTPSACLRAVRLQRVHDELLRPDEGASVTSAAMNHGFIHLGRFSAQYRETFGEAPSATLRRGRAALTARRRPSLRRREDG